MSRREWEAGLVSWWVGAIITRCQINYARDGQTPDCARVTQALRTPASARRLPVCVQDLVDTNAQPIPPT